MPTFPPPRVDITSKTWPSFADMLLRRWREGGTFGESGFFFSFCAPVCQTSAGLEDIGGGGLASSAASFAPTHQLRLFECNF